MIATKEFIQMHHTSIIRQPLLDEGGLSVNRILTDLFEQLQDLLRKNHPADHQDVTQIIITIFQYFHVFQIDAETRTNLINIELRPLIEEAKQVYAWPDAAHYFLTIDVILTWAKIYQIPIWFTTYFDLANAHMHFAKSSKAREYYSAAKTAFTSELNPDFFIQCCIQLIRCCRLLEDNQEAVDVINSLLRSNYPQIEMYKPGLTELLRMIAQEDNNSSTAI